MNARKSANELPPPPLVTQPPDMDVLTICGHLAVMEQIRFEQYPQRLKVAQELHEASAAREVLMKEYTDLCAASVKHVQALAEITTEREMGAWELQEKQNEAKQAEFMLKLDAQSKVITALNEQIHEMDTLVLGRCHDYWREHLSAFSSAIVPTTS